ncbi:MAG: hypothetical protein Q9208_007551 [Pyrenodesmia sp. 3 TL-2023]
MPADNQTLKMLYAMTEIIAYLHTTAPAFRTLDSARESLIDDEDDTNNNDSNATSSLTGNTSSTFISKFHGDALDTLHIIMGAIGSIVQATTPKRLRCQDLVDNCGPERLEQDQLLDSMVKSVNKASRRNNMWELKVLAKIDGRPMWQGEFASTPGPEVFGPDDAEVE